MHFQVGGLDKFPTMAAAIRYADMHNHKTVSFPSGKDSIVYVRKDIYGVWRMSKEVV